MGICHRGRSASCCARWGCSPGSGSSSRASSAGPSDADVSSLFLWVYGWVGVALVSIFIGPAWHFLDPFSTLHDLGAAIVRRLRRSSALGPGRLPRADGSLAGSHRLRRRRLAGARAPGGRERAVHLPGRVHGADPGDDGPVRPGRMAVAGRGLHRLVPAAGPARAVRAPGRGGPGPAARRSPTACWNRASRWPTS